MNNLWLAGGLLLIIFLLFLPAVEYYIRVMNNLRPIREKTNNDNTKAN